MLDGKEKPGIKVSAKSKNTIARAGALIREQESQDKKEVSRILEILLPAIAILQIPILFLLLPRFRRLLLKHFPGSIPRSYQPVNNTAFLFIHRGMVDEAKELIEREIRSKGADCLLLGNHALYAIKGDFESAAKCVEAAYFYARQKHERAVVLFNRSLISFLKGEEDIANQDIRKAVALSRDEISRYCQFSTVFAELSEKYHSLREICMEHGKKIQSKNSGES